MAIAIITAGGTGVRFGNSVPKQFITVNDIPVIVYTMLNVQNSGCYQEMYIVCADGWKDFVFSYAQQYDISIFKDTISEQVIDKLNVILNKLYVKKQVEKNIKQLQSQGLHFIIKINTYLSHTLAINVEYTKTSYSFYI